MTGDPIRLAEDPAAAAILRGDLGIARSVHVHGLNHAAGLGALRAAVGAETGAIPAVTTGAAGGSLAAKLLFGAAVIGGVAWWAASRGDDPAIDPPPVNAPVAAPVPSDPIAEPEHGVLPAADPAPVVPQPSSDELTPAPPEEELAPVEQPAPGETKGTRHKPRSADIPGPQGLDDAVVREAKQVQAARRALATDAAGALALTESIAEEFPRGQLVEERLAIAIRALAKLGRTDEARTRAEAFLKTYGRGAHASAVRRAVGL